MNGKKENERETEKDPETRRKWDRIQERNGDMQKWRSGKTSQGTYWGERKKGGRGQKSFYDIHVHIKPRATLRVHYW